MRRHDDDDRQNAGCDREGQQAHSRSSTQLVVLRPSLLKGFLVRRHSGHKNEPVEAPRPES